MTPKQRAEFNKIADVHIQEMCRIHTLRVVNFWLRTIEDDSAPIQWRLQSARDLAGYGWGRPSQVVEAKVEGQITNRYKVTFELSDIARPGSYIDALPLPPEELDS